MRVTIKLPQKLEERGRRIAAGTLAFLDGVSEALGVAAHLRGEVQRVADRVRRVTRDERSDKR
jgi:hypothetical protein